MIGYKGTGTKISRQQKINRKIRNYRILRFILLLGETFVPALIQCVAKICYFLKCPKNWLSRMKPIIRHALPTTLKGQVVELIKIISPAKKIKDEID